jgi:hypothetical protein
MDKTNFIQTKEGSSVWILKGQKNGLIWRTVKDENRFVSITLTKLLKEAGIEDLTDTELLNRLEYPKRSQAVSKKVGRREALIAR